MEQVGLDLGSGEFGKGREVVVAHLVFLEYGLPAGLGVRWALLPEASCVNHCLVQVLHCVAFAPIGPVDGPIVGALSGFAFSHSLPEGCCVASVACDFWCVFGGKPVRDGLCIKEFKGLVQFGSCNFSCSTRCWPAVYGCANGSCESFMGWLPQDYMGTLLLEAALDELFCVPA